MADIQALCSQREILLNTLKEIAAECEGVENEVNAQRVQELNLEQIRLTAQKSEMQEKSAAIDARLSAIRSEMGKLSAAGVDRILEAIQKQRWYFFENKTKVLMDRDTGLLWADLNFFPWCSKFIPGEHYGFLGAEAVAKSFRGGDFINWRLPRFIEFKKMIADKTFPYHEGDAYKIKGVNFWYCDMTGCNGDGIDLSDLTVESGVYYVIPCNSSLIQSSDYAIKAAPDSVVYTPKQRAQFTLELFLKNDLIPAFAEQEINDLYRKMYIERPKLAEQLQELQTEIEKLQKVTLLSSDFDYAALLSKYDMRSIDNSLIQYYQAVQQWTDELLQKLDVYEQEQETVIREYNQIGLKLSKKFDSHPGMTEQENQLLADRQRYLQQKLSLELHTAKSKIRAVRKQADALESRMDEIDSGDDAIHALALLEQEQRVSFAFLAENTAKIIQNALKKMDYFKEHRQFVQYAIDVWEKWTDNYRVFKTTYRERMRAFCEEDGIEEDVWSKWYSDWQDIRFAIEEKLQPIIERGLKGNIPTVTEMQSSVPEMLIDALEQYKEKVDRFFLEERKGIYQKYVFQSGGELQEKFESENELYKCTDALQSTLQEIIFHCSASADRVFILKWANSLLDMQINEILAFVADNDLQKISQTILSEFAALRHKNFEAYLTDAHVYGEQQARREKEYNSLMFKMRKELMKS